MTAKAMLVQHMGAESDWVGCSGAPVPNPSLDRAADAGRGGAACRPTARAIDAMCRGCLAAGLSEHYISWLGAHCSVTLSSTSALAPRPEFSEWLTYRYSAGVEPEEIAMEIGIKPREQPSAACNDPCIVTEVGRTTQEEHGARQQGKGRGSSGPG